MPRPEPLRPLSPGSYAATLTFFKPENEELDLDLLQRHIVRITQVGLSGIVALGSNGEAPHLSSAERIQVISRIRSTLDNEGLSRMLVIVGASGQSAFETIRLCEEAATAGGDYALVLPPCYYKAAMTDDAIFEFYKTVSARSPLPVIIYSYPDVSGGINLDSDLVIRISSQCENVVGTKFTCGDTGKLARVARAMDAQRPNHEGSGYWCAGGLADFTLQALVVGASAIIAGGANITPKAVAEVFKLFSHGQLDKAAYIQGILAEGDWVHTRLGVGGTKAALQDAYGYGGRPRLPLNQVSDHSLVSIKKGMAELIALENSL